MAWVALDPARGAEIPKTRPCVIVSREIANEVSRTVTVVPLSSLTAHALLDKTWGDPVAFALVMSALKLVLRRIGAWTAVFGWLLLVTHVCAEAAPFHAGLPIVHGAVDYESHGDGHAAPRSDCLSAVSLSADRDLSGASVLLGVAQSPAIVPRGVPEVSRLHVVLFRSELVKPRSSPPLYLVHGILLI